jgi:hypothetical protein
VKCEGETNVWPTMNLRARQNITKKEQKERKGEEDLMRWIKRFLWYTLIFQRKQLICPYASKPVVSGRQKKI